MPRGKSNTSQNTNEPVKYTAKQRVAYHREKANEAFKTDDKVKAYGHVKAHGKALGQLNWWMNQTDEQKSAFINNKQKKT